jgi:hypothetical protein
VPEQSRIRRPLKTEAMDEAKKFRVTEADTLPVSLLFADRQSDGGVRTRAVCIENRLGFGAVKVALRKTLGGVTDERGIVTWSKLLHSAEGDASASRETAVSAPDHEGALCTRLVAFRPKLTSARLESCAWKPYT